MPWLVVYASLMRMKYILMCHEKTLGKSFVIHSYSAHESLTVHVP